MLESSSLVKFLPLIFSIFCACSTQQKKPSEPLATTHQKEWRPQEFQPHENWLGMNIEYRPIEQIRKQIEQISGATLLNRNEAHITVVTPVEYDAMKEKLSITAINKIAEKMEIQKSHWKPICVGSFTDPKIKNNKTYFIVVESNSLLEIRREIYQQYLAAGGSAGSFIPHHYYPHITIGYVEKDIYESDGAIKDTQTCFFDLATPDGKKITSWNL